MKTAIREIIMGIIAALSGWKMLLGYLILNLPLLTDNPALTDAIDKVLTNPTPGNIATFVGHAILVIGSIDRLRKNVSKPRSKSDKVDK